MEEGDPFNALTFFRLADMLDGTRRGDLAFRMALCYELGDQFAAAEQAYLDLAGQSTDWSVAATYRAAMSARAAGRPAEAALHLQDVVLEGRGTEAEVRAQFMLGVTALDAADLAGARAAFKTFRAAHPEEPLSVRADAALRVLDAPVPRRSPVMAGALSALVPGAGQLYSGHAGDAFMAFFSSGVLGLWSYSLIRSGVEDEQGWRVGTGAALGTVAAFTWTSNVFGAVRGARRTNSYLRSRRSGEVLRETADPRLEASAEDALATVALRAPK